LDSAEVAHFWNENAEAWTILTRMGCDLHRDRVNTPAFLAMLPDVSGLKGLDIGCGEGHNTRLVAGRGAKMTAIDIASVFVEHARGADRCQPAGIEYRVANASDLPFSAESFDFVMATMSLMDMPDHPRALAEAFRVLKPGGFFQFSISHPCFATPRWQWSCNQADKRDAMICGDYFRELNGEIEQWMFSAAPAGMKARFPEFRIPRFTRTLSSWLNLLIETGFAVERFEEPHADEEMVKGYPALHDTRVIAHVLMVRCRKRPSDRRAPA